MAKRPLLRRFLSLAKRPKHRHTPCRRFSQQVTQEDAVARPVAGSQHLRVIQASNSDTGARITLIGVERIGEVEHRNLANEIRGVLQWAKPDTVVLQFCEDRYKKNLKEQGADKLPLNLSGIVDMRHLANTARMGVHLINQVASGPRFNYNMFAIEVAQKMGCRIVLGDIPMNVLMYKNEVGRSLKEAKDYIRRVDRKRRRQAHFPGLIPLLAGIGSLERHYDWCYENRKGILHKEKILTDFATELHNKRGTNASYLNETCYAMAHAAWHAEGEEVVVLCNHLAIERIYLNLGKTEREKVRAMRSAPPKPLQATRLLGSWLFNWWNFVCAGVYGINYYSLGYFDPVTAAIFLGLFPASYPICWAGLSFHARRRVQKFQKLIWAKRSEPKFQSGLF